MIGIWMSFGPDGPSLLESVAAWRERFPDSPVAVCDDGRHPMSPESILKLAPDHYERSDIPRFGNIRKPDAILTILDLQERMHSKFPGHPGAVKMDCDTIVNHGDWLIPGAAMCGFEFVNVPYPMGCARYLSEEAATAVFDHLLNRAWCMNTSLPEDGVIGVAALTLFGPECCVHPLVPRRCVGWDYRTEEYTERNLRADVVTFGNRNQMTTGTPCEKRERVAVAMAKYRKHRIAWLNP